MRPRNSRALIGELAGKAQTGAALGMVITLNFLGAILGTPSSATWWM
ncbi:MAG: hypothetical protein HY694_01095 [Deltaproteobacteria bacterium]|nr:hypothetical protein [Deltaproteobacteria bacterium]